MALQKQHNGVVICCFSRNMSSFKTYIQIINPFTTIVLFGLPCGSAGKESTCNVGDLGSIPGLGRSPGEGKGYPLQYSGLEKSMDCRVHGVTKSWTQLSNFHFLHLKLTQHCESTILQYKIKIVKKIKPLSFNEK